MAIRGLGPWGVVREPRNSAYLGLPVPKPLTAWKKAHAHARQNGLLKRGERLQDRGEWHITVMSPQELRRLKGHHPKLEKGAFKLPLTGSKGVQYKGIGRQQQGSKTVYYVIVDWEAAQDFRAEYGLSRYDLHVTIGYIGGDIFNVPKGRSTKIAMERYAGLTRKQIAGPTWNNNHDMDLIQVEEEIYGPPLEQGREVYVEDLGHFDADPKARPRLEIFNKMTQGDRGI